MCQRFLYVSPRSYGFSLKTFPSDDCRMACSRTLLTAPFSLYIKAVYISCLYVGCIISICAQYWIAQSVRQLATSWTVRGSNPGRGEFFRTDLDPSWGPPILLHNEYRVITGLRRRERGVDHPPHLVPRLMKEYSYTSTATVWAFVACSRLNCLLLLYTCAK
jgi:hypothetical protein